MKMWIGPVLLVIGLLVVFGVVTNREEHCPQASSGDVAEVMLAITENELRSNVARGENAGRKLSHTAVVRKLISIGSVDSQGGSGFTAEPNVRLERGWKRGRLRAVVFVQERASHRILGAAAIGLMEQRDARTMLKVDSVRCIGADQPTDHFLLSRNARADPSNGRCFRRFRLDRSA